MPFLNRSLIDGILPLRIPRLTLAMTTIFWTATSSILVTACCPIAALPSTATTESRRSLWDGRETVWPHDFHTGWSYCISIPSWVFLSKSRGSNPVVFYRVQVGLQSPEGITTIRGILRRFNDFLKLFSEVRQVFPKKNLPPAPPKGILKIKSQTLLEERRYSLENWMGKLLSDIDVSRSAPVATFLELEAAVRSSFYDENQQTPDANSSIGGMVLSSLLRSNSDVSGLAGGLFASDHGNDTPYEISEVGTPRRWNDNSTDPGLEKSVSEQYLIDPYKRTVKHGMFNRKFIQESLQRFSRHQMNMGSQVNNIGRDEVIGNNSGAKPLRIDGTDFFPELGDCEVDGHVRRLSTESVGSDLSSVRAETSHSKNRFRGPYSKIESRSLGETISHNKGQRFGSGI